MEIEAKYRLRRPTGPAEIEALALGPYRLGARREHDLLDRIYDTRDRRLAAAGLALRLRRDGAEFVATLKSSGRVAGAVHEREEIEAVVGAPGGGRPAWPEPIAGLVRPVAGDAPLRATVTVHNRRYSWPIERGGSIIGELALDGGVIRAGGRRRRFREIEVELKGGGSRADLASLSRRLRAQLRLEPEPLSKFARGLALLVAAPRAIPAATTPGGGDGRTTLAAAGKAAGDAPAAGELAAPVPMPELAAPPGPELLAAPPASRQPAEDAAPPPLRSLRWTGCQIVLQNLQRLAAAEDVAREGSDPEGVHDMRVATRRMRAALQVMEESGVAGGAARRYRRGLRALAGSVADVRDADVMLQHLAAYEASIPGTDLAGLAPLRAEVELRRARGRMAMLQLMGRGRTRRLLAEIAGWAQGGGTEGEAGAPPVLVRHVARSTLWRRYEEVLAFESAMPAPAPVLHQLRISFKRLRYTIEFFAGALGPVAKELLRELAAVQDRLGALQDAQVGIDIVDELARRRLGTAAMHAYRESRCAEQDRLVEAFAGDWERFIDGSFARRLGKAISAI